MDNTSTEQTKHLPHFKFGNPNFCTYCGDPANATDHLIPFSYHHVGKRTVADRNTGGPVTFCCQSCNSIKGTRYFSSFDEICRHVRERLNTETYAVEWSVAEMKQLDYKLRTYVERERNRRLWMRSRSDWFESRSFLLNIENLLWIECLDPLNPSFNKYLFEYFEWTILFIKTIYDK